MNVKKLGTKIAGAVFAASIMLGVGVTTHAQYPNDPYRRDRDYRREQRDRDYERDRDQRRDDDWRGDRRRSRDDYPDWGGSFQLRQTALNAGANEGNRQGRDDRRHNRRPDFRDNSTYQKATKDYSSKLGDRYLYQRYFRMAYEHGYADGYEGY